METLKAIVGKIFNDRVRNSDINATCNVEYIVGKKRKEIMTRPCRKDRLAHIAKVGKPATRRPLGRSPKRWKDSSKSIPQEKQAN